MAEYTRGPRMVAGGAAGGFEEDFVPMSDERAAALSREAEQATLDEIKKMIAPSEKPKKAKSAMSDKRAAELLAKADAATNELLAKIGGPVTMTKAAATAARRKVSPTQARVQEPVIPNYMIREDGTIKGQGYFGPIQHASGAGSTELSIGYGEPTSRAYTHRSDRLYPSLVPTLTREEIGAVVGGDEFPESVYQKARAYGEQRLAQGRSPFAQVGEQYPAPGYEQQFMTAYPSAVMSYPNRTVGYQYAAGAPVTPYMSPVASRPIPVEPNMSLATAMSSRRRVR